MEQYLGIPAFYAKNRAAWRRWLQKNHSIQKNVWLIIYRKGSGTPSVYYSEAVDEALCFGWIDSKANKRDGESFYQSFAKRNPKSKWSKINKEKAAKLIQENLMKEAGLTAIELAKQNGAWAALDAVEELHVPGDLQKELLKHKKAVENFEAFPRSVKKGILEWVLNAKRPETRQKRIAETAALAAKNIRANQYRP